MSKTNYELTIYIAGAGARLQEGGTSAAGHIWYGLSGQSQSFGFAPKDPKSTLAPVEGKPVINDTQNYRDAAFKITYQVTEAQYQKLLEFGRDPFAHGFNQTYWAPTNSCVDFVWAGLAHAGINSNQFEGSTIPIHNRTDLQRFVDLPIVSQIDLLRETPNPNGGNPEDPWYGSLSPDKVSAQAKTDQQLITEVKKYLQSQPVNNAPAATGLDTPARNSAALINTTGANTTQFKSGGGVDDLWVVEKNAGRYVGTREQFRADFVASNGQVNPKTLVVQQNQTYFVPQRSANGNTTYHYSNGAVVTNNAVSG